MRINAIDAAVGVIFILIGAFFAIFALNYLPLGTSNRMGPGYFPTMVGGLGTGMSNTRHPAPMARPIARLIAIFITTS